MSATTGTLCEVCGAHGAAGHWGLCRYCAKIVSCTEPGVITTDAGKLVHLACWRKAGGR